MNPNNNEPTRTNTADAIRIAGVSNARQTVARTLALLEEWYPEQAWVMDNLEIIALDPNFTAEASSSEEAVEAMLDTLGVSAEVRADLEDLITEAKCAETWSNRWATEEQITDPGLIAEMAPYLSTSEYSETREMVEFGYAYAQTDPYESDGIVVCVSVEKGKVPAEVIELLLRCYLIESDG